jgi:hypothetical protein
MKVIIKYFYLSNCVEFALNYLLCKFLTFFIFLVFICVFVVKLDEQGNCDQFTFDFFVL